MEKATELKEVAGTIIKLVDLLRAGRFNDIDEWFGTVDVSITSTTTLVTMLRFAYPVRDFLPHWKTLLESTVAKLDATTTKPERRLVLRGLERPEPPCFEG